MTIDLLNVVEESFSTYAGMTIQNRALVDARDGLKPAARQCMYAQILDKITYKKPYKKAHKSVTAAMDHFYVHGDASCYELMTRLAKVFTMRYPLEDFKGNYGTISASGNEAAARYTEMRLGELGCLIFNDIDKNCIDTWFDNYDDTQKFPSVSPSLGFYNICNGSIGIATAISSSIPQFNLKEINEAMIRLLWNPNISFDEIYCAPDFCTGATILNANEVKESLKNGRGKSAIIRGTIEYNDKENALYVVEIPYGVYVGTIIAQIKDALDNGLLTGVKKVDDLSGRSANLKILLEKNTNVQKIVRRLYKLTSIQSSYTINMTMLENGTRPVVFGWREALQAHLNHEIEVRTKIHEFNLEKIAARINIIDGLLLAIANIEDIVEIIKSSNNKDVAKKRLIERFNFNELQVDAILKMTLSRLINLEIQSFKDEKNKLKVEEETILAILNNKELLFKEIETGLREVSNKFGDNRRTRLMNLEYKGEEEDAEPIEEKELLIYYTNHNNIYTQESTTLMTTRRGRKGSKVKLGKNEVIIQTINDNNLSELLAFTNTGKMYSTYTSELPINAKINCSQLFELEDNDYITTLTTMERKEKAKYLIFVTKNGIIKKTKTSEYQKKRGKSLKAINLKDNDEVLNVYPVDNEKIGFLTSDGNCIIIETENISPIGRAAAGVKGIKLNDGAQVIDSQIIENQDKFLIAVSKKGYIKKMNLSDIGVATRGTKGKKIQKLDDDDMTVKMLTINTDRGIIINTKGRVIKINSSEISLLSRDAAGTKSMNLEENEQIQDMLIS